MACIIHTIYTSASFPKLISSEYMQKIHLADILAFAFYIAASAASLMLLPDGSDTLLVEADGTEYAYSLSEDGIHHLEGPLGTTDIEIKDGKARIIASPCPNGTCMKAGWSDLLCCLPNRIIARTGSAEGGVDAVSG